MGDQDYLHICAWVETHQIKLTLETTQSKISCITVSYRSPLQTITTTTTATTATTIQTMFKKLIHR